MQAARGLPPSNADQQRQQPAPPLPPLLLELLDPVALSRQRAAQGSGECAERGVEGLRKLVRAMASQSKLNSSQAGAVQQVLEAAWRAPKGGERLR